MAHSYIIGVDIGTGSTKALAVTAEGTVIHRSQKYYESTNHGSGSEQDMQPIIRAFQESIAEIVKALGTAPTAVSLSSAMHSIMAVGEDGRALTPAILWSDTRSTAIAQALRMSDEGKEIYLATGTPLHAMSPLCKIKWLVENQPEIIAKTAKFIGIKEAIWYELFGEYVIDHSLASATGLFNIRRLAWHQQSLQFLEISGDYLSKPVPVTYNRRAERSSMLEACGLPAGTLFYVGASDGCLANLGSLCLDSNKAAITIGTSAAVRVTTTTPVSDYGSMVFNYILDGEYFVCGGAVNNGGNVFQWLLQRFFQQNSAVKSFEQLFDTIANVPAGSNGLFFLPYIHGERAPIWDEKSTGCFFGVNETHTSAHFGRAVAEGVCFSLKHVLQALEEVCGPVEQLIVSGGLNQSEIMMQLLSDVTGKKLTVQQADDASALGAAYLAQKELGIIDAFHSIKELELKTFYPQETASFYHNIFSTYKSLYPALKQIMNARPDGD